MTKLSAAMVIITTVVVASCSAHLDPSPTPTRSTASASVAPAMSPARPTLVPTPSPAPSPVAAIWRPVPPQSGIKVVEVDDVIWTGDRFVAVGQTADAHVVFMTSTDGATWQSRLAAGPAGDTTQLAAGPGGVVAVGSIGGEPTSWTSPDGVTFTEHRNRFRTRTGTGSRGDVADVVARGAGWLAVGSHNQRCEGLCAPDRALVWTSSDGADWTQVPDGKSLHSGFMEAVATGNDGFVAVGPSLEDGAAIWTSSDGIAWRSVSDRALEGLAGPDYGVGATGVVARDGTVVVVGYASLADDSTVALAWSSRAGGPWTRSEILGSEPGSSSIIATADGFLASGWPGDCPAWIWASNDGRTWRCDATEPKMKDFIPVAIAASGSIDVAVGWTENADTTAWYRTRR